MLKEVFKPYKKKISAWSSVDGKQRDENGRTILCVEIGEKEIKNNETGEVLERQTLTEDIYMNVLKNAFTSPAYSMTVNPGYEPKLVITCEGNLVMHNDKISGYVEDVKSVLYRIEEKILISTLVDGVLTQNEAIKYSETYKALVAAINNVNSTNYSAEFIFHILKDYVCEDLREQRGYNDEMHYLDYVDLMHVAEEVLSAKLNLEKSNKEDDLCEELLYRFIKGELKER